MKNKKDDIQNNSEPENTHAYLSKVLNLEPWGDPEHQEIVFIVDDDKWIMKFSEAGIVFNHKDFPDATANDMVKAFIELMEKNFAIKFIRNNQHHCLDES